MGGRSGGLRHDACVSLTGSIARSALSRPQHHPYGPDRAQTADLHLPDGAGPFPVAVLLHGGSWRKRYGKLIMRPLAADLARRAGRRGTSSFRRLGNGGGWPMTFDDVAAGIDALAELGDSRLDVADVTSVGHSSGGQLALWSAARPESRVPVARVVGLAPVTSLGTAGPAARALMGGGPGEVPERYAQADPLRRIPLPVPVLLVHPHDDGTVPVERSREYAEAARARGGDVALRDDSTGGHRSPIDPASAAWQAAAAWLAAARV